MRKEHFCQRKAKLLSELSLIMPFFESTDISLGLILEITEKNYKIQQFEST